MRRSLSAAPRAERQGPAPEDIGQLYRRLRERHSDATLMPEFMRQLALLLDATEEDAQ